MHTAAVRTGDANFIEPITNFQKACHEIVQPAGLVPFIAEADEPFNAEWYQVAGTNAEPPKNAIIAETISTGYSLEGQVLRPAIVRLRNDKIKATPPMVPNQPAPVKNENAELPL
ncbi:MAG: nucleotide exchange factor GrpE [Limisphaerales bacterium]